MIGDSEKMCVPEAIEALFRRYPQLGLPVRAGMKDTAEYRDAVRRGIPFQPVWKEAFHGEARLSVAETPAGLAEILTLTDREDFLTVLQQLAYRCEPVPIPDAVGAMTVRGLINWEKIRRYREEFFLGGGTNWNSEYLRFTAEKRNYLDTLILLSEGSYSGLQAEQAGLSAEEWKEKSLTIRTWHELTHFVCRSLYPDDADVIRDEVVADMIGLMAAFGSYDAHLAELFLGVEGQCFREGGRLSHYVREDPAPAAKKAKALIAQCSELICWYGTEDRLLNLLTENNKMGKSILSVLKNAESVR